MLKIKDRVDLKELEKYGFKPMQNRYILSRNASWCFTDYINKRNNNVSNLEWATEKENQKHKWKNGFANYNRDERGRFI